MSLVVRHATQVSQPNNPDRAVSATAWNADHSVEGADAFAFLGSFDGSDTESLQAAGDSGQTVFVPAGEYTVSGDIQPTDGAILFAPNASLAAEAQYARLKQRGHWTDLDNGANVHRLEGRVFIGTAIQNSGNNAYPGGAGRTWLGEASGGYMTYYDNRSQLEVISSIGGIAGAFASRSSDALLQEVSSVVPIAVAAFALNDATDSVVADRVGAWGFYGSGYRDEDDGGAQAGSVCMLELDVANLGSNISANAYGSETAGAASKIGVTYGLILGSGGEIRDAPGVSLNNTSAALVIANNGSQFEKGIIFQANAIVGGSISSPTPHDIVVAGRCGQITQHYSASDDAVGARIRMEGADNSIYATMLFQDNGVLILQEDGEVPVWHFQTKTSAVNGLVFEPGTTGNPVILRPRSDAGDSNIPVVVRAKGASSASLQGGDGNNKVAANTTGIGFFGTTPVAAKTGWSVATGSATRTTFATTSVTLEQLAERVKALIDDMHETAGYGLLRT